MPPNIVEAMEVTGSFRDLSRYLDVRSASQGEPAAAAPVPVGPVEPLAVHPALVGNLELVDVEPVAVRIRPVPPRLDDSSAPGPTALPPLNSAAAALARKLNEHKLETDFHGDEVVHRRGEWTALSSSKTWTTEKWRTMRMLGSGGFGSVWLQENCNEDYKGERQLRAVKMLSRNSLPQSCESQELLALVKLGEVSPQPVRNSSGRILMCLV